MNDSVLNAIGEVWNFTVITVDQNDITIGTLSVGLLIFLCGILLAKLVSRRIRDRLLAKFIHEKSALYSVEAVLFYIFVVLFALFSLKMANIPLTIFTVVGGAIAIGVGFGSQNIVNNLISGFILMAERPIKIGDFIEVDDIFGEVIKIGMRSTVILAPGYRHMIVPNSRFLESSVLNWTHEDFNIRASVMVGVAYGSDVVKVEKLLYQAVKE